MSNNNYEDVDVYLTRGDFSVNEAIALSLELGLVDPVVNENGAIFTDENGAIYTL